MIGAALVMLMAAAPVPAVDVHVDQIGFLPKSEKTAIIASDARRPLDWRLKAADGSVEAKGRSQVFGPDAASGDVAHRVDFSRVMTVGNYKLEVAGAAPVAVHIAPHIFRPLSFAALNYFYQTRAGIPIAARYAGGDRWARAAGHPQEVAGCFKGRDERGNDWPGCDWMLDVTGGWYDAGDQGKYVVNGGIALWTLQNMAERKQLSGDRSFADGAAKLPEAGNGIDDLMDESRWEMRFLMAMQIPEGKSMALPVGALDKGKLRFTEVDVSGMAHQKIADRAWTKLPTAPADDPQPRYLYPPTTAATLNLAATAAQCARIWRSVDPAFSAECLKASERAFAAALRHPDIFATGSFTGSGGYGDAQVADEFYWATAELYATTGEKRYGDALRQMAAFRAPVSDFGWADTAALGTISLALVPDRLSAGEQATQRKLIVAAANGYLAEEKRSGYKIPYATTDYPWGSNGAILNRGVLLGLAADFTGEARYRGGVIDTIDYVLGRNPLGQSYVTGFGTKPMQHPHHRFWARQFDARYPPPPPGVLSGGPNNTSMVDDVSRTMKGNCAPARCWVDDARAFTMNEVTINWNAPLFWVAAYLDEPAPPQ